MARIANPKSVKAAKKTVAKKAAVAKKAVKKAVSRVKTVAKTSGKSTAKKASPKKPAGLGKEIKTLAADTVKAASATAAFLGAAVKAAVPKVEAAVGLKAGRRGK